MNLKLSGMRSKSLLFLLTIFSLLVISSCQKPLSDQDVKYLGQWSSDKYSLEIWKNGSGTYQKKKQDPVDCWVKIENNRIKFKTGATTYKSFRIDSDPYVNGDGFTVMILDNQVFYKL